MYRGLEHQAPLFSPPAVTGPLEASPPNSASTFNDQIRRDLG